VAATLPNREQGFADLKERAAAAVAVADSVQAACGRIGVELDETRSQSARAAVQAAIAQFGACTS
jgi:hypothetical protein